MFIGRGCDEGLIHVPCKAPIDGVVTDLYARICQRERIEHRRDALVGRRVIDDDGAKQRIDWRGD